MRHEVAPASESGVFAAVVGRPLMFVAWVLILWGTLYGVALAYAIATAGLGAWQRALSGGDRLGGLLSVLSAAAAVVVWSALAILWLVRRRSR